MVRFSAILCAGLLLWVSPQTPAAIARAADRLLEDLHGRGMFNGAVVLGRGGDPLYARGFGPANVAAGVAFTPDTPADGASIAKTMTAAAVYMLRDAGKLALDDPVQRHLPEYPHGGTRVRHLISHTAGLPEDYEFFDAALPPDQVRTTAMFLRVLRDRGVPPAFEPGTAFRYSSFGFDVAALIVERLSRRSYADFLRARVFQPLRMGSAFVRPARLADWPGVRTLSYRRDGTQLVLHDIFDNEGFYGGSNVYFSALDLYRWSRSFYTRPVLPRRTLAAGDEAAVIREPGSARGGTSAVNLLGWYYPARGRRYHYPGSLQGFWSSAYRDEDRKYSVVYVSNNSMPQWLRPLLTRALIDIMERRTQTSIELPTDVPITRKDLSSIAGLYAVRGVGRVSIEARDGRAFVRVEDGIEYPAFFVEDGQLYVPGLDVWIGFPGQVSRPFSRLTWRSIFHVADGHR